MLSQFKTYRLAVEFHHHCRCLKLPGYLKDQLLRASSSVALNLAEGHSKFANDQMRYFRIAFASLRESQAALDLAPIRDEALVKEADILGAHLFRLCNQNHARSKT